MSAGEGSIAIEMPTKGEVVLWRHGLSEEHLGNWYTPDVVPAVVFDPAPELDSDGAIHVGDGEPPRRRAPAGTVRLLAHDGAGRVIVVPDDWFGRDRLPLVPYGEDDAHPGRPAPGCWCRPADDAPRDFARVPRTAGGGRT